MLSDDQWTRLVEAQAMGKISKPLMILLIGLLFAFSRSEVEEMITCLQTAAKDGQTADALLAAFQEPFTSGDLLGRVVTILLDPLRPEFLREVADDLTRRDWKPDPGTLSAMFQAVLDLPDHLTNKAALHDQSQLIILAAQATR